MHGPNRRCKRNFQWRQFPNITPLHDKLNKEFKDFTSGVEEHLDEDIEKEKMLT